MRRKSKAKETCFVNDKKFSPEFSLWYLHWVFANVCILFVLVKILWDLIYLLFVPELELLTY